jgi:chitin synthase
MGRDKETKDDLCQQPNIDLESTIQTLKLRYENNLMYTRIGDGILIALHPSRSDFQQSLDYVAEYKNSTKTSLLPCHIFQLVNQAYLHMRRTGIDQSIVLR